MERVSPKVDIAFKKIFGVEENKDLLISLFLKTLRYQILKDQLYRRPAAMNV